MSHVCMGMGDVDDVLLLEDGKSMSSKAALALRLGAHLVARTKNGPPFSMALAGLALEKHGRSHVLQPVWLPTNS